MTRDELQYALNSKNYTAILNFLREVISNSVGNRSQGKQAASDALFILNALEKDLKIFYALDTHYVNSDLTFENNGSIHTLDMHFKACESVSFGAARGSMCCVDTAYAILIQYCADKITRHLPVLPPTPLRELVEKPMTRKQRKELRKCQR